MKREIFIKNGLYHVYNRGVDKRDIVLDEEDVSRYLQSMDEFNTIEPIGSIYENSFRKNYLVNSTSKIFLEDSQRKMNKNLVNFIGYCLNLNHYHFILEQVADDGVQKFMQRFGTGYTKYFNNKYQRSGALFQGVFKASNITINGYLLHLSVYVNLNDRVHQLGSEASKLVRSSWGEYVNPAIFSNARCKKDVVLNQFNDLEEYKKYAEEILPNIIERKKLIKESNLIFLE